MIDVIHVVWSCFDMGLYTHETAMNMLTNPSLNNYIPIVDVVTVDVCAELFKELN